MSIADKSRLALELDLHALIDALASIANFDTPGNPHTPGFHPCLDEPYSAEKARAALYAVLGPGRYRELVALRTSEDGPFEPDTTYDLEYQDYLDHRDS